MACHSSLDRPEPLCTDQCCPLQESCEVLIGTTDDDRLDLANVFVRDLETDIFSEPERIGALPETLQRSACFH